MILVESTKVEEDKVIDFEDENLAEFIRGILGVETITRSGLLWLESVDYQSEEEPTSLAGLEHAENVKYLRIMGGYIADFSPLCQLNKLETVDIYNSGNVDSNLVDSVAQLANLKSLRLIGNQITEISPLRHLTRLSSLELCDNHIEDLSSLADLSDLINLGLANNHISDLSPLAHLFHLRFLTLDGNDIRHISDLANMSDLQYLHLSHNEITDLDVITQLPKLEAVTIDYNPIDVSFGSLAYQIVQQLLNAGVFVQIDHMITLRTKDVSSDSITVNWSFFENFVPGSFQLRLFLNGEQVKVMDDLSITEHTFTGLEDGNEYEVRMDCEYSTPFGSNFVTQTKGGLTPSRVKR